MDGSAGHWRALPAAALESTMHAHRTLGIVALFVVLAAGVAFWLVSRGDGRIALPPVAAAGADAAAAAHAEAAAGGAAPAVHDEVTEASSRVEAASAGPEPATGPGVVGQVVDPAGQPVPGAAVSLSRDFDFDPRDFDAEAAEDLFGDPESVVARVRAARGEAVETVTDANGRFRLGVAGKGDKVALRVLSRGFLALERTAARPAAEDLDLGVLQLERGAVISGRVVDRAGKGIANAAVTREPPGMGGMPDFDFGGSFDDDMPAFRNDRARTDADGRFELANARPGDFSLRARHVDHPSTRQEGLSVTAGSEVHDVMLVLEPGAVVRGRVVGVPDGTKALRVAVKSRRDANAGQASGAEADGPMGLFAVAGGEGIDFQDFDGFGERTVRVEPDGSFEVRGLNIGRGYTVWATQSGRGFLGSSACTQRLDVTTPVEGIELRYEAGVSVTFRVVADDGGAPVEQLWVSHSLRGGGGGMGELMQQAMNRRGKARNYPDGRVTIASLRPKEKQTLSLGIDAIGFRSFERKDIALPQRGELDLGVVRLAAVPVLNVQVLADVDGQPIAGATVRARATKQDDGADRGSRVEFDFFGSGGGAAATSARTDADGRCVLNAPEGKPFVVTVRGKEFAAFEAGPMTLASLGNAPFVARLRRGGSVEVTVVDADGAPVPAGRVMHRGPADERGDETTGANGTATFAHLQPGEHRFRLAEQAGGAAFVRIAMDVASEQAGAEEPDWQTVLVEDGAATTLQLTKPAGTTLHGVVRENGVPLANARVTFLKGDDSGLAGDIAGMMVEFGGGGDGSATRTDSDGAYRLRDLPEGSHRLRISTKERAMPALVAVELRGADNTFDVDLDVAIVRGVVRDADGAPIDGAKVRVGPARSSDGEPDPTDLVEGIMPGGLGALGGVGGQSVKTDASGRYELRGLQVGTKLQVRASAKGSAPAASAPFEVQPGAVRDGVDLQLERAGRIKVTSTEKVPFAMAMARRLGADGEPEKGETPVIQMMGNGSTTLSGLRAGRWRVTLQMPSGDAEKTQDVDVTAGQTATVAF